MLIDTAAAAFPVQRDVGVSVRVWIFGVEGGDGWMVG